MGTVLTMLLELEKDALLWRSIRLFSVLTTQKKFKNATITGHFRFVFDENSVREITWLALRHLYEKLRFQCGFRAHENEKTTLPYSSGLKSVLEKLRFLERLVWTVGLTVEINLHFQISPAYGRCHKEILFKEKKNKPISEVRSNEEFSCPGQKDWALYTRTVPCCNQLRLWLSAEYQLVPLCRPPVARV